MLAAFFSRLGFRLTLILDSAISQCCFSLSPFPAGCLLFGKCVSESFLLLIVLAFFCLLHFAGRKAGPDFSLLFPTFFHKLSLAKIFLKAARTAFLHPWPAFRRD